MRTLILSSIGGEIPDAVRTSVTLCKALKLLRIGRLLRKVDALSGANFARVMQYIFGLLLVAHWLGIVWYAIAIQPLQRVYPGPFAAFFASDDDDARLRRQLESHVAEDQASLQWYWMLPDDEHELPSSEGMYIRYICSLYWALSVMTNLKGLPAHESRECFYFKADTLNPFAERVFTIGVFIVGTILYAAIYGNIAQFLQNLDRSGSRFRKKMDGATPPPSQPPHSLPTATSLPLIPIPSHQTSTSSSSSTRCRRVCRRGSATTSSSPSA